MAPGEELYPLVAWAMAAGVVISPLAELRRNPAVGIGLFATRDVPAGHAVMSMPMYLAIESSPLGPSHGIPEASLEVAQRLSSEGDSPYTAFLRGLPMPRNAPAMTDNDLETDIGRQRLAELRRVSLFATLPRWAVSHVLSRTHQRGLPGGGGSCISLFPMIDLLNHHNDVTRPTCHYEIVPGNGATLVDNAVAGVPTPLLSSPYMHMCAVRSVVAGEELVYTYSGFDGAVAEDRDMYRLYGGFELCGGRSADVDETMEAAANSVEEWLGVVFPTVAKKLMQSE